MSAFSNITTNVFQQALACPGEKATLAKLHRQLKRSTAHLQSTHGHPLQLRRTWSAIWLDAAELAGHLAADPFVWECEQVLAAIGDRYRAGRSITLPQRELHRLIMSGAGADHAANFEAICMATVDFQTPEHDPSEMEAVLSALRSLVFSFEYGSGSDARHHMSNYLHRFKYSLFI